MSAPKVGPRLLAGLVIVLTFVVGGLAGAVADRSMAWRPAKAEAETMSKRPDDHGPPTPQQRAERREKGRERFVQQMTRDLGLDAAQVARIDSITRRQNQRMDSLRKAMWPRYDTIITETRGEIDQVLTPAQREKVQEQFRLMAARKQAGAKTPGPGNDTTSGKR